MGPGFGRGIGDFMTVAVYVLFPLAVVGALGTIGGAAWLAWYLFHHVQFV